jgi:hypothetical protein
MLFITLRVETRYTHYLYTDRTVGLLAEIRNRVVEHHRRLADLMAKGIVQFDVVAALPGTLNSFMPDETE